MMPIPRKEGGAGGKMDVFKARQVDPHTFEVSVDETVETPKFQNMVRRLRGCLSANDEILDVDDEAKRFTLQTEETESSRIVLCLMDKDIRVEIVQ